MRIVPFIQQQPFFDSRQIQWIHDQDVTTPQIVFESGASGVGTAFRINAGNFELYAGSDDTRHLNSPVLPNTTYSVAVAYDLTNDQVRLYVRQEADAAVRADDLVASAAFTQSDWAGAEGYGTGVGDAAGTNGNGVTGGTFLGSAPSQIDLYNTADIANTYTIQAGVAGGTRLLVADSGNVGIGTDTPTYDLSVEGDAQVTGILYDSSGDAGTNGQILSTTANGTNWIDNPMTTVGSTTIINNDLRVTGTTTTQNLVVTNTMIVEGDTTLTSTTINGDLTTNGDVINNGPVTNNATTTLNGPLVDSQGNVGDDGQILSSTGTATL